MRRWVRGSEPDRAWFNLFLVMRKTGRHPNPHAQPRPEALPRPHIQHQRLAKSCWSCARRDGIQNLNPNPKPALDPNPNPDLNPSPMPAAGMEPGYRFNWSTDLLVNIHIVDIVSGLNLVSQSGTCLTRPRPQP